MEKWPTHSTFASQPIASSSRSQTRFHVPPNALEDELGLDRDSAYLSLMQPGSSIPNFATGRAVALESTGRSNHTAFPPFRLSYPSTASASAPALHDSFTLLQPPVFTPWPLAGNLSSPNAEATAFTRHSASKETGNPFASASPSQFPSFDSFSPPTQSPFALLPNDDYQPFPFGMAPIPQTFSKIIASSTAFEPLTMAKTRGQIQGKGKAKAKPHLTPQTTTPSTSGASGSVPPMTKKSRKEKAKAKAEKRQLGAPLSPIQTLEAQAQRSMNALGHCGSFDPAALRILRDTLKNTDFLAQLVSRGIAYTYYDVVCLLYQELSPHVVTRESLSKIRAVITCQAGLNLLFSKFTNPGINISNLRILYGVIGAMSMNSMTRVFFAFTLKSVLTALCACAGSLPSLLPGLESRPVDETAGLLQKIHDSDEEARLEWPHPAQTDAFTQTLAPSISRPEPTGARTADSVFDNVDAADIRFRFGESYSAEGPYAARADLVPPSDNPAPESGSSGSDPWVFVGPGWDDIADSLSYDFRDSIPGLGQAATDMPFDAEETSGADVTPDGEHDGSQEENSKPKNNERLRRHIQNTIMCTAFDSTPCPAFPEVSVQLWDAILSSAAKRDPLETIGDAAMYVVMLEVLIELVEAMVPEGKRVYVRSVLIQPLLSNATFLHYLRTRSIFTEESLPKYPGNTFEVLAGAIILCQSLLVLKNWVRDTFRPVINGVIAVALVYKDDGAKRREVAKAQHRDKHPRDDTDSAEVPAKKRARGPELPSKKGEQKRLALELKRLKRVVKRERKLLQKLRQGKANVTIQVHEPIARRTRSQLCKGSSTTASASAALNPTPSTSCPSQNTNPPSYPPLNASFTFTVPFPTSTQDTYDPMPPMVLPVNGSQYTPLFFEEPSRTVEAEGASSVATMAANAVVAYELIEEEEEKEEAQDLITGAWYTEAEDVVEVDYSEAEDEVGDESSGAEEEDLEEMVVEGASERFSESLPRRTLAVSPLYRMLHHSEYR
ncbi:hypothetical protein R3P38DRAFT_1324744 [Favolaschia claudopus]|uniref:Uncharacterized protein n=1 Tax=Favolaschia claudopus TaxID=2862362 RepID=A0AAW0AYQ0_9AGAR